MNILNSIEKVENGLGVLFHFGRDENEMTMDEARHLIAVIQVDMAGHVDDIREEVERSDDMDQAAMRARADLAGAQAEIKRLTGRVNAALKTLKDAGDRAISASVAHNAADSVVTGHIAATAVRIGIAKRELQGLDEILERQLAANE